MKLIWKTMILVITMATISSCSDPESVLDMATGRWASKKGNNIILVDLRNKLFVILQMTPMGPIPVLNAKNLKVEKTQKEPQQVRIAYDYNGKHQTTILRILRIDDDNYRLAIVNSLNGSVKPLNFVSSSPTLDK